MASKKQTKKSTGRKTTSGKRKSKSAVKPYRREVGAAVCLVLAVLCVLACFGLKGALLGMVETLFKGLIGSGFYVLPFSFVMGFVILLLHDGRPVSLRVTCSLLLAVLIGALVQLVGGQTGADWSWAMFGDLWKTGCAGASGGAAAGFLAQLLEICISRIGAVLVLIVCFLLCLLTSLNMTVSGIIKAIKNRPRPEYEAPKREHKDPAETIVNHVAQKHIEHEERRRARASDFDLPVDDPPLAAAAEARKTKKTDENRPMRPDEYLEKLQKEKKAAKAAEPKPLDLQPKQEPHPDYKEQFDSLVAEMNAAETAKQTASAVKTEKSAPRTLPPLVIPKKAPVQVDPPSDVLEARPVAPVQTQKPAPEEPLPPIAVPEEQTVNKKEVALEAAKIAMEIETQPEQPEYQFPPVDLLKAGNGAAHDGTEEMRQNAERLNDTLESFGIEAHIINVTRGPSVTRYELELSRGVKLSKVTNLADDIALALGSQGVRIAAIPEKVSVVGIEVPNRLVSTVFARDVIDSPEFSKSKSRISFAVGKDIGGSRIIGDIAKLPHMLIAGTTGSGKSVCMNSLIISLLYKAKPEEVKLIMVDPKMVELSVYDGIPHLLIPVVTDPKKAAGALQWGVTEMMRRYRMMADAGVRDLESYNKQAQSTQELEVMPQLVVVIDELADLMLVAAKEVEESICRIAQMGRAAGIHLVIATQRPSADVITGLMKANIPSRIAFAVASAMESRIILDTGGAEKLVGKGDMLYAPLGQGKPKRVQGCFITDDEVQDIVSFVKQSNEVQYSASVMEDIDKRAQESGKKGSDSASSAAAPAQEESDGDEMLPAAVEVILEIGQASVSMLQRRLKLGYPRAAHIMDEMEERGIVGPYEGSKPRQLLITKEQWQAMQNGEAPSNPPVEEEIP